MRVRLGKSVGHLMAWMIAVCWAGSLIAETTRKPNILLIVADDLGYEDLGFQGVKDIPTPSIDALAASGVRLSDGYVTGTWCSPTRAGLLTGRYQQRFGAAGHEPVPGNGLSLDEITIADRLREAGYVTGIVGKWHLGVTPEFHPLKRGFDEFFGFLDGGHVFFPDWPIIIFPDETGAGPDFGEIPEGSRHLRPSDSSRHRARGGTGIPNGCLCTRGGFIHTATSEEAVLPLSFLQRSTHPYACNTRPPGQIRFGDPSGT